MLIEPFFDAATSTFSYLLLDRPSGNCAIIDSVLDYDQSSGRTRTHGADTIVARVRALGAKLQWILETHVHADHLSAAPHLKSVLGGQLAIGARVTQVQSHFGELFNAGPSFDRNGRQFDRLLADDEMLSVGALQVRAVHTPGHTPACLSYLVSEGSRSVAFVGDTLFTPDYGTARCDFPGGDARTMYRSIRRLLSLPLKTELYLCHDYAPAGREPTAMTTVAEQRAGNVHMHDGIGEAEFVDMRTARDATLGMPTLLLPSVQVNMRGGELPEPESNGIRYLKIPLNAV